MYMMCDSQPTDSGHLSVCLIYKKRQPKKSDGESKEIVKLGCVLPKYQTPALPLIRTFLMTQSEFSAQNTKDMLKPR